jgi:hypothetical protein
VPTRTAGTFFRQDRVSHPSKCFNKDGTFAASMRETPRALFARTFGTVDPDAEPRGQRLKRSVLDAVVDQSKFYPGDNAPLGAAPKARLSDHLDRVREYERRASAVAEASPRRTDPYPPPDSKIPHGGPAEPGGEWRLLADGLADGAGGAEARRRATGGSSAGRAGSG